MGAGAITLRGPRDGTKQAYRGAMEAQRLWTFGHSTRTAAETVELLDGFGIGAVIDVRTIRGSRHNPQFGEKVMPGWLAGADIDYRWIEALGGRRRAQPIPAEVNAGWTHPSFHRYADYALTDGFAAGLAELMTTPASAVRSAIMCAEAVPWRCHRSLIATALVSRGWQVTHILGPGQSIDHEIGRWGPQPVVTPDGSITYPAAVGDR